MISIEDITPVTMSQFKKACRASSTQAGITRTLMLDLLAKAYESQEFIHAKYYDRANELLNFATNQYDGLYKAIMRKEESCEK